MSEDRCIDPFDIDTFNFNDFNGLRQFHVFSHSFHSFRKHRVTSFFDLNPVTARRRHLGFSRGACLDRKAETDSRGLPYKVFRGMPNVH